MCPYNGTMEYYSAIKNEQTSGQDGGVDRYTLPPCTTKRRTTKDNQTCQKIELYGSLTAKELKKKHSFRLVGGAEVDSRVQKTHGEAAAGGPGGEKICGWVNQGEQLGSDTEHTTQGSSTGK